MSESRPPSVRVGIVEERKRVDFKVDGKVSLMNLDGSFAARGVGGHWKVEVVNSKPANSEYRLAVGITKDRYSAEEIVTSMGHKGLEAHVKKYQLHDLSIPYVHKATYQVLLNRKFKSEEDAKVFQAAIREKTNSEIIKIPKGTASGTLRFTNLDNKYSFDAKDPIRLNAIELEIADVDVGSGFHWEKSEHRTYGGTVEFLIDFSGAITVVNQLSLESYLKGVVPSEMPAGFPYEALKAQAVAARVEAITKIGLRHPIEAYDLCDDVHCQVFSGKSKHAQSTNMAVESTQGIFMIYKNQLSEAFYAGVCGGHTENNENVWLMDAKPYLRGILDRNTKRLQASLQDERNLKKWIDNSPDVFCNTTRGQVAASVNYSKKYFRWRVEYERSELEKIIRDQTGEDFGRLIDLVPVKRGVSGRLIELEVVGSQKRFMISQELAIRQGLSNKTLFSACFYVKKIGNSNGFSEKFILKGAGWGHGVGMCQVGAAMMAHSGKKFDEILTHYYRGIFLQKLYN